jgi:DNA-binding XRE family transcriptional regulator
MRGESYMIKARKSLKLCRIKCGIFQRDVAGKIGITTNSYSLIETRNRSTTCKTARAICNVLGKSFDDLFVIDPET